MDTPKRDGVQTDQELTAREKAKPSPHFIKQEPDFVNYVQKQLRNFCNLLIFVQDLPRCDIFQIKSEL